MASFVLSSTKSKNNYLFSYNKKKFLLIHPLLKYIINLSEKTDVNEWFKKLPDKINVPDYGDFSKEEINYYYEKYLFLYKNSYFKKFFIKKRELNSKEVKHSISNCNSLVFEVTELCNLNCEYCVYGNYYDNYDKRVKKHLSFTNARRLIDFHYSNFYSALHSSNNNKLNINFYGGEPLLNFGLIRKIITYLETLYKKNVELKYNMTTNGLLLNKYIDFLVKNNFHILVSLDGNKENNSYRLFRNKKNSFNIVFNNLKFIQKKHPVFYSKNVKISTVIHNKNSVTEVNKYFKQTLNKGEDDIIFSRLSSSGVKKSKEKEFYNKFINSDLNLPVDKDYSSLLSTELIESVDENTLNDLILLNNEYNPDNYYLELLHGSSMNFLKIGHSTCIPGEICLFMLASGKIMPCEHIGHEYNIDYKIVSNKINVNYENIAKKYDSYYKQLMTLCPNCYNIFTCSQCMFNLNLNDEKIHCSGFMNKKKYAQLLSNYLGSIENNPLIYSEYISKY